MTDLTSLNVGGMPTMGIGGGIPFGRVFFVCNRSGAGGADGNDASFDLPMATITGALGRCTAGRGDVVVALQGHAETVTAAAGIAFTKTSVKLVGVGEGSERPTINFTTVVGADIDIDAANVTIQNFLLTGGIDALTGPIDVNAAGFRFINCETRDVTGQATDWIVTDDACDRLYISGWKHAGAAAAGADTAITLVGGDDWVIEDFDIYGNFAVAAIENVTTAANRIRIGGGARSSYIWTENAADVAITLHASTTGNVGPDINIMLQDNAANITEAVVGAAAQFFLPINVVNLAGEASMVINITASTDA